MEKDARAVVAEYYARLDAGRPDLLDLFSDDAQFYFPKFGISHGKASFGELLKGLLSSIEAIAHDKENLIYVVDGSRVAVEGTTQGKMRNGEEWSGGKTPGGRFSSIFEVENGLIRRMHVYLDPDYAGADKARFLWPSSPNRTW